MVTTAPSWVRPYSILSAGRTSMPTTLAPPSRSTETVTFMALASIHTRLEPLTRPAMVWAWQDDAAATFSATPTVAMAVAAMARREAMNLLMMISLGLGL